MIANRLLVLMLLFCLSSISNFSVANANDWPQFRGPSGNATAPDSNPPVTWSDSENIVWKTELPGRGASSPIVFGNRIFLTAYTGFGVNTEEPGDKANLKLHVLCFERDSGKLLWDRFIKASPATQSFGQRVADHGYATATPATDGEAVYAGFGVSGIVAYDMDGNLMWQAAIGDETAGFGSAASPVVYGEMVYVNASIESKTLFAFDKRTGKEVWKAESITKSWTTPCIAEVPGGSPELILNQQNEIFGFDPITGEKLWWCAGVEDYIVPVPVVHNGVAYCLGGRSNRAIAVKLGGRGDVTKTHKLWQSTIGANVTSPVYFDGHLYWASDKAIENCLRASDGKEVYQQRLPTRARIYSSIVRAGNKFYVTTRDQGIVVLAAKPEYEELAVNLIKSDETLVNASPAISGNQLLLRTDSYLYCIGE
ncbi:MAG: PQQ-binding-like beta-propeller repeat protein [Planctomycetaceae bacterium]|nr:PQQ-binding-like beta-propeller repeat protein [Planctomycetaceae bacterium]